MKLYRNIVIVAILILINSLSFSNPQKRAVTNDDEDGMGGTGRTLSFKHPNIYVSGHITAFGSIYVNDIPIKYNKNTFIEVDGKRKPAYRFNIGETVDVEAYKIKANIYGLRINVRHEIIGQVTSSDKKSGLFKIMGQTIIPPPAHKKPVKPGQWLKVSGYTDSQGIIHATHLNEAQQKRSLLTGYVHFKNGKYAIRNVTIQTNKRIKLPAGKLAILEGTYKQRRFNPEHAREVKLTVRIKHIKQVIAQGYIRRLPDGAYTLGKTGLKLPDKFGQTHAGKRVSIKLIKNKAGKFQIQKVWRFNARGEPKLFKHPEPVIPRFNWKRPNKPETPDIEREIPDFPGPSGEGRGWPGPGR